MPSVTRTVTPAVSIDWVVIEIVDSREHVDRLIPILDEMVTEGLVTLETVRVLKYAPGSRPIT